MVHGNGGHVDIELLKGLLPFEDYDFYLCGTCAKQIRCGKADYIEEPSVPRADDEVLICCATPRSTAGKASCGEDGGVILDL